MEMMRSHLTGRPEAQQLQQKGLRLRSRRRRPVWFSFHPGHLFFKDFKKLWDNRCLCSGICPKRGFHYLLFFFKKKEASDSVHTDESVRVMKRLFSQSDDSQVIFSLTFFYLCQSGWFMLPTNPCVSLVPQNPNSQRSVAPGLQRVIYSMVNESLILRKRQLRVAPAAGGSFCRPKTSELFLKRETRSRK